MFFIRFWFSYKSYRWWFYVGIEPLNVYGWNDWFITVDWSDWKKKPVYVHGSTSSRKAKRSINDKNNATEYLR